jgi:hypothetical protein
MNLSAVLGQLATHTAAAASAQWGSSLHRHTTSAFLGAMRKHTQTRSPGPFRCNMEATQTKSPRPFRRSRSTHTNRAQAPGVLWPHRWTNPGPLQVDYGHKHEGQNPLGVLWPRTHSPGPFSCIMATQINCRGLFRCSMATQITNIYTCTHVCV